MTIGNIKVDNKGLIGLDGYTEIRKGEILEYVLEDIERKAKRFPSKRIRIKKGITIRKINKKINANKKDKDEKIKAAQIENERIADEYIEFISTNKNYIKNISRKNGDYLEITFVGLNDELFEKAYNVGLSPKFDYVDGRNAAVSLGGLSIPRNRKGEISVKLNNLDEKFIFVNEFLKRVLNSISDLKF